MTLESLAYSLPARLTADNANELIASLQQYLNASPSSIELLGSRVDAIDAAGLQLLLSFYKSAVKSGKRVWLTCPSPLLSKTLDYTGVSKVFDIKD